jgi:hypothetical protein
MYKNSTSRYIIMTLIRLFLAYFSKLRSLASSLSKAVKRDRVAVGCKRKHHGMRWRNAAQLLASHNQNPFHLARDFSLIARRANWRQSLCRTVQRLTFLFVQGEDRLTVLSVPEEYKLTVMSFPEKDRLTILSVQGEDKLTVLPVPEEDKLTVLSVP